MATDSWSLQPLGNLFPKIVVGYVGNVNKYYCEADTGVPFYRTLNIRDGHFRHDEIRYVTRAFNDKNKKSQIENGDVVIARVGANLGMTCQVTGLQGSANMANAIIIKAKDAIGADPDFFAYYLVSPMGKNQIFSGAAGGAQGVFNTKLTQEILVPNPPLPEQKKIAEILSTWDQAITATERMLENSQQRKKGLMQELLTGKKRLKGFSGDFKRRKLEDLAEVDARNLDSKTPAEFRFRYISLSDVDFGRINTRLSEHKYETSPSRARRIVKEGDLLFATVRPNLQGFAKVLDKHDGVVASTGFAVLSPRSHVCGNYLYHYLFSTHITGQVKSLVAGSNYPAISSGDVKKMLVYCPDFDEQAEIAEILNACDLDASLLSQRLHVLKEQKRALMQQLLTGKRRVSVETA